MRNLVIAGGAHQQPEPGMYGAEPPYVPLAARPDVLVFQTEPLVEDIEVTGPVDVTLWVSSSALDTDFTAKLLDIYPPNADYPSGYHLNLTDSIIRARYRDGFDRGVPMEPGAAYRVQIDLPPTSNLFKVGHRIRVDVASSSFPKFDVNPNTGEPVGRHTHTVKARNTVYLDRERPSQVVLPVIPGPPDGDSHSGSPRAMERTNLGTSAGLP
jgi:putative CocE/NonD family hydrolase